MLNGDASSLEDVWSNESTVTTMQPIGGREVGWDGFRASFERVAQLRIGGYVERTKQFIQVAGDVAYELEVERGQFSLFWESKRWRRLVSRISIVE